MSTPPPALPGSGRRATRRAVAGGCLAVLALLGACSSDDDAAPSTTRADGSTTTTVASQFGSSMGVAEVTADEVSALGDGPVDGQSWTVPFGFSICGRFIEPLTGSAGGVTSNPDGTVTITSAGGGTPTVGDLAEAVGITLAPGSITLPADALPAELDSTDPPTQVAGATLADGDSCGSSNGALEVWVYSADATETGDGIMVVAGDVAAVPFAQDGMSVVLAFAPESSLPTLPPSAIARG